MTLGAGQCDTFPFIGTCSHGFPYILEQKFQDSKQSFQVFKDPGCWSYVWAPADLPQIPLRPRDGRMGQWTPVALGFCTLEIVKFQAELLVLDADVITGVKGVD